MNIIKKIESSEITRAKLSRFQDAMQDLVFVKQTAVVHLGEVKNPDTLVQVADFFLKMAEATWSVASGVYDERLVVIIRNAGFRRNAGKFARDLFGKEGTAGGHKDSARAEILLENIGQATMSEEDCRRFVLNRIRKMHR